MVNPFVSFAGVASIRPEIAEGGHSTPKLDGSKTTHAWWIDKKCVVRQQDCVTAFQGSLTVREYICRLFLFLLMAVSVSACATTSYNGPQSGITAKIRFASMGIAEGDTNPFHNSAWLWIMGYEDKGCAGQRVDWATLVHTGNLWSKPKRLAIPLEPDIHKNAYTDFAVDAGKPNNWLLRGGAEQYAGYEDTYYRCGVVVSESFDANKSYEVLFFQPNLSTCHVTINEIVGEGKDARRVFLKRIDNSISPADEACRAEFNRTPLY